MTNQLGGDKYSSQQFDPMTLARSLIERVAESDASAKVKKRQLWELMVLCKALRDQVKEES